MTLTKPRLWVAGTVVVCLLLVVAGWFLLISPQRAEAAELRSQTQETADQNEVLAARVVELKTQFAELPQRKAELAAVRTAMPQDAELAVLTRDLTATAKSTGVTLMAITPGTLTPQVVAAPPAPAPDAAAEGGDAAAAPAPATVSSGVSELSVGVEVVGSYKASVAFLESLQTTLDRDYLVDGINVLGVQDAAEASGGRPAVTNGDITLTLTGRVFVLESAAADAAAPATVTTTDN